MKSNRRRNRLLERRVESPVRLVPIAFIEARHNRRDRVRILHGRVEIDGALRRRPRGRHPFGWTQQANGNKREEVDGEVRVREWGFRIDGHPRREELAHAHRSVGGA